MERNNNRPNFVSRTLSKRGIV